MSESDKKKFKFKKNKITYKKNKKKIHNRELGRAAPRKQR